jgi:exo-beta-1,3-glucanase (GH17 family)
MQALRTLLFLVAATVIYGCAEQIPDQPVRVEIVRTESGYELWRDGKPYEVRGAGMAFDDFERFVSHGGNSIRNWSTHAEDEEITRALLDAAYANGVTVSLCLSLETERWGFDYDDEAAVQAQFETMREEVLKYRDHPALLTWIIGNELDLNAENHAVYDAVNEISKMIHELDPNHPTTSTLSGFDEEDIAIVRERAPDLDFFSFQVYGSLFALPEMLAATEFDAPFMVTEWGAVGYWETEKTAWGAPLEKTSTEKADVFWRGYTEKLAAVADNLIGSYAFVWGQKQERTPTWFGMFTEEGYVTEAIDVLHRAWTGEWPDNRTPQVHDIRLNGQGATDNLTLVAGQDYEIVFDARDPDGDTLRYRWEVKPESEATSVGGDREEVPQNIDGLLEDATAATTTLKAPPIGNYRLFGYAFDEHNHAAHANIPFRVNSDLRQDPSSLIAGEVMAMSYSGYREGQHPDRGDGAVNPSDAEILEDLQILVDNGFTLLRMYDADVNTQTTLRLIREHQLPVKVLLGMWLRAEFSNHEGCEWLHEPIPQSELDANTLKNEAELKTGIRLANEYEDIIVAVNVGNEALVDWNDHMVPVDTVISYVRRVQAAIPQPVTVADNYVWWAEDGAELVEAVDFIGIHTYAQWEEKTIDEAMSFTLENLNRVRNRYPEKPYAILEAGWATTAREFGERANVPDQARYYEELKAWATDNNVTVFFFEAFDEPWKGNPDDPLGAEKHWGVFYVDRTPKHESR